METARKSINPEPMQFTAGSFEGPLDLLLHLIRIREVEIEALSILDITEQFLEAVQGLEYLDLEQSTEFVLMASSLIAIKARYMSSGQMDLGYDPGSDENPLDELVERLRRYKKVVEASGFLRERHNPNESFLRDQMEYIVPDELDLEVSLLKEALQRIMSKLERFDDERQIYFEGVRHIYQTVESKIQYIEDLLETTETLEFTKICIYREDVVVVFLALLELLKAGKVNVVQEDIFSEIYIKKRGD